jgi:hypothetical protein
MMESAALAKARPRRETLAEYEEYYARELSHRQHLSDLDASHQFRWKVELECGCITEALTEAEGKLPTDGHWNKVLGQDGAPVYAKTFVMSSGAVAMCGGRGNVYGQFRPLGCCRPNGYLWCSGHDESDSLPWREITRWIYRKSEHPAEIDEHGHHHDAFAIWAVELSCGHCASEGAPVDWIPEYGHKLDPERVERVKKMLAKHPDPWFENLSQVNDGCPTPNTKTDCNQCVYLRRIVAYKPIGQLARPRPERKPRESKPPSRAAMTRRINAAEANAAKLRRELAEAEEEAERLRKLHESL